MIVSQHPVGPCFLITPWNFPLAMATRKIAPALAAGCTVVIKPAELTPLTTLAFAKLLEDAGLPKGVVNVFTTSTSGAVSEPIIRDPRLRKLSFTGSTPGRPAAAGAGGGGRAAHVDGARRQRAVRGVRGRRPRQGGRRRDAREVPQHRPGVHRGEPVHRAPLGRRRVRPPGHRAGAGVEDRPGHRGRRRDRPAHRRRRGREGVVAGDGCRRPRRARAHRRLARSTARARSTSRPSSPTCSRAATSCARRSSARCSRSSRSTTRTRPCASRTTPSTGSSRTSSPRASRAVSA